jgi:hypothetical protein
MMSVAAFCVVALAAGDAVVAGPVGFVSDPDAVTIPRLLSYQGKLTDVNGIPVTDTLYEVRFRLYAQPAGGTQFWEENQQVRTKSGLFSALLGSVTPIGSMPDAGTAYLGMAVAGGAELTPRLRIASSAYAYLAERAANSDALQGRDTVHFDARFVNENQLNSVTSPMLVNGAVTSTKIYDGEVNNADLAPGAVTGDKLNQMGATTNQVLKWTGATWAPRNDSVGGSGGGGSVTSVAQSTGVVCTPNPITTAGTVAFDQAWGDGRYVNVTGDSITDDLAILDELRVYDRARIGPNCSNTASQAFAVGNGCTASGNRSSVLGGWQNGVTGNDATIAGGAFSLTTAPYTFVGAGYADTVVSRYSGVLSGYGNVAGEVADDSAVVVAGGYRNDAMRKFSTISGGSDNWSNQTGTVIAGGSGNMVNAAYGVVGGGYMCATRGEYSVTAGGYIDSTEGDWAVCGGGELNCIMGDHGVIGGGRNNRVTSHVGTIGGGSHNTAGYYSTVCGGWYNTAAGNSSAVPAGAYNSAQGNVSLAAGHYARANHRGCFVLSDSSRGAAESLYTTGADQFRVRARGGTWFYSNAAKTTGAYLAAGTKSWASACDSATKEDFREVDRLELLNKVAALRVRDYKMKDQDDGTRHIGPVAQDFAAAFGVGENNTSINMADADGVLLAAVQALYDEMKARDEAQQLRIGQLEAEVARMKE